ncbi:MAG: reprolysin-like metallopeptidase [Acidobacteriota bacterium]
MIVTTEDSQVVLIDTAAARWRVPDEVNSDAMVQPSPPVAAGLVQQGEPIELKAAPSPQTTIDVLVAYTPALATRAGSTAGALLRLDQLIATSNQAYVDSEVAITLRLAHVLEVSFTESDDSGVALGNLTSGAGVLGPIQGTLRDRYGTDIVALVRPFNYPAQAGCGVGWVGGYGGSGAAISSQSNNGFAVVSDGNDVNNSGYYCQNSAFAHELGYSMGAMHDRQTVTEGAIGGDATRTTASQIEVYIAGLLH